MPGTQLTFTEENVKKNPFDYPKLKLANGETALLTIVEDPYSEYVHSIQKPVLDEVGNILTKIETGKNGAEYTTPRLTWVSSPICLGNREVLDEEGIDPENCPICKRAADGAKGFRPKRRFAMHVIRTNTAPGTFDANGTGGQLLIWAFTDTIFNKLFGFQKKFGLDKTDLEFGPCTDANFQKADLNVSNGTVLTPEEKAKFFDPKNRSEDPSVFCGTRKALPRILEDLEQVDAVYAKANGDDKAAAVQSAKALSEGLGSLLEEDKPAAATAAPEPVDSFDELPDAAPAAAPAEEAEAKPAEAPAAAATSGDELDSILDNL